MSLIADALKMLQKTRLEQAQKPGKTRLRGILPPMKQIGYRKRFLKGRFILVSIIVGSCVFLIVLFRPFHMTIGLHESERKSLERRTTEPITQSPRLLSTEENFSEKPSIDKKHTPQSFSQRESQKPSVVRQSVVSSLPLSTKTQSPVNAQEENHRQETDTINVPSPAKSSTPLYSDQKPETHSDLTKNITSESKLSETVRYQYNLGVTFQKQGQLSKAEEQYKKVIQLDPLNVEAHNNLGLIYKEMGKLDDAIDEYQKAISIDNDYWKAHHNLGVVFYNKGNLEKASAEYVLALKLNPKDIGLYNNLGLTYKKQGRHLDAEKTFKEALSINPTYPETYYNLALIMEEEGNLSGAVYNYRKFIQFSSDEHSILVEKVKNHLEKMGERQRKR